MSILGNSEEAGASKNEEARASNNEYRCHYQRVEILKVHIREMPRAVAGSADAGESPFQHGQPGKAQKGDSPAPGSRSPGEEPRCGGVTFPAVSALKNSKR